MTTTRDCSPLWLGAAAGLFWPLVLSTRPAQAYVEAPHSLGQVIATCPPTSC